MRQCTDLDRCLALVKASRRRPVTDTTLGAGAGVGKPPVKEPARGVRRWCRERYGDCAALDGRGRPSDCDLITQQLKAVRAVEGGDQCGDGHDLDPVGFGTGSAAVEQAPSRPARNQRSAWAAVRLRVAAAIMTYRS